jgi:hypothetical protein
MQAGNRLGIQREDLMSMNNMSIDMMNIGNRGGNAGAELES